MLKNIFILVMSFFLLLFLLPRSYGMEATIKDLFVTITTENVLVYFRVTNCFTKDMEEAILAGFPTTFTFLSELYQEREYWLDKRESRLETKHTIKYDNIKKIFYVSFAGVRGRQVAFRDFNNAKKAMADLNGAAIAPLKFLKKNKQYYIRVKAKLDKVDLPLHMERILFFVSLWDFETDWCTQGFVY